jgi:hypothetical protein
LFVVVGFVFLGWEETEGIWFGVYKLASHGLVKRAD